MSDQTRILELEAEVAKLETLNSDLEDQIMDQENELERLENQLKKQSEQVIAWEAAKSNYLSDLMRYPERFDLRGRSQEYVASLIRP